MADLDPTLGSGGGIVHYNQGNYVALPDDFVPYHYSDKVAVVPLLGRDPALTDRNETLQTSGKGAQVCTFSILVQGETDKATLAAFWATQTTHDLGDGVGARNVTVTEVDVQLIMWRVGATPIYKVTITTRTR
jgi:hypothetical protein